MASVTRAKINNLNSRAREFGRPDSEILTLEDASALASFYDRTCLKCGKHPSISIDHVKPLSKGGANVVENCQILCDSCNKAKRDEEIDYRQGKVLTDELVAQYAHPEREPDNRNKIDWDEVEFDYVTSLSTLRELANKYGISLSNIGAVSSRDNWTTKRTNYRNKIGTGIVAEVEAANVREGFSAYKATFVMLRRAFDDYMDAPTPEKLRAIDGLLTKGLTLEGFETERKGLVTKSWKDSAQPEHVDDIQQFATAAADNYYSGDSGSDRDASAGWTD